MTTPDALKDAAAEWSHASVDQLVDHILAVFHRPLDTDLPYLDGLTDQMATLHGDQHPNVVEVRRLYRMLMEELLQHMAKEEQALFPMARQGIRGLGHGPVPVMQAEHRDALEMLSEIRSLCGDYRAPSDADDLWHELYAALSKFERDMHLHIHLEEEVLFPMIA